MRILTLILIAVLFSGCLGRKVSKATEESKTLLEQINPATGKHYTPKEVKEIKAIDEESDYMDKLLSTPILLVFAIAAILFIAFGAFALYRAQLRAAIACFIAGPAIIGLPIVVIILFQALTFLLYIFCGLVVLGVIVGLWWLYNKHRNEAAKHQRIAHKAFATVEEVKSAYPNNWQAIRDSIDLNIHDDESREAVKEFKKQ